jgi:cellulose synthase/poly-beta-1,6-N-acetylglucosamine synthase-like glycosyltransferase
VQRTSSARKPRGRIRAATTVPTPFLEIVGRHPRGPVSSCDSEAERLAVAVGELRAKTPELSAAAGLRAWQKASLATLTLGLSVGALVEPKRTIVLLLAVMAIPFLMAASLRLAALWLVFARKPVAAPPRALSRGQLPTYSVLVPLFREGSVVPHLLQALRDIDYPCDKMDVLLIVESIDQETQTALADAPLAPHMRVVVVPDGQPRTKPRALQYALQLTRGEYIVVFDAEDAPEPDQLRRAAAVLRHSDDRLGCLQAQLNIYNSDVSWLTRQFTIEYTALFDCILPALQRLGLPVPLGGTSNHFKRSVLDSVGGWDPYNVTEDADLGIRLARQGWLVGVLPSTTWEEAPPTFGVWLGQRTRWLKGWMQTYLVHMREPRRLMREFGTRRFFGFQVLMGGLILSALVHPWFYAFLAFDLRHGFVFDVPESFLARTLLAIGLFNLVVGYVSAIALGTIAAARRGRRELALYAALMPVYWLAISIAAYRALLQLVTAPYYWEKTPHSVSKPNAALRPVGSAQSAATVQGLAPLAVLRKTVRRFERGSLF